MNASQGAPSLLTVEERRTAAFQADSEGSRCPIPRQSYRGVNDAHRQPFAGHRAGTDDAVASRCRTVLDE